MDKSRQEEVRYAELLPCEFRRRLAARPIAYLPLGTLEWHGEHLPLGADALISEGWMMECARRLGGIVLPPLYLGPDRMRPVSEGTFLYGMDLASETNPPRPLEGSCYWASEEFFGSLVEALLQQVRRAGFRAVFADGHGPSRHSWARNLKRLEERSGLMLLAAPVGPNIRWEMQRDHAAKNETSQMMAIRPDLVELSFLPPTRSVWPQGVAGEDPRDSDARYGRECISHAVLAVEEMLKARGI